MLAAGIFLLGVVFFVGYEMAPDAVKPTVRERPEKWAPKSHEEMLRACGVVCGPDNVKSYSSIYGKCECKEDPK